MRLFALRRIIMDSIRNAKKLQAHSDAMLTLSIMARSQYIDGMKKGVGDDELRHLHHDAMEAAAVATKAHNATLGARSVQFSV
jgi:hypothetical protein